MQKLQLFKYESNDVRTLMKDGEVLFVAKDVCRILELHSTATRRLYEDEKVILRLTQGENNRSSNTTWINEAGLYSLVLGSRKPEAKQFKRWITHEVLPSIYKHGAYMTDATLDNVIANSDLLNRLTTKLREEQQKRKEAEQQKELLLLENEELKIKAEKWDEYLNSDGLITFRTFGIQFLDGLSAQEIRKMLQEKDVLAKNKVDGAYQAIGKYKCYFKLVPFQTATANGEITTHFHLKLKNEGIEVFLNLFKDS